MKWRVALVGFVLITSALLYGAHNSNRYGRITAEFSNPDPNIRARAHDRLQEIGPDAAPAIGKLLRANHLPGIVSAALEKFPIWTGTAPSSSAIRYGAMALLSSWGPDAAAALPDIVPLLVEPGLASEAEALLRKIGPASGVALAEYVRRGPESTRVRAAQVLRDYAATEQTTRALIAALKDRSPKVRAEAAASLGALRARAASDQLQRATRDSSESARARACEALGLIGEKRAAGRLAECLRDRATGVRLAAAKALWKIQHDAAPVLPILIQLLETGEGWQAAYALGELRCEAVPAVPALIEAMRREQVPRPFRSSGSATYALGQIGALAIPQLVEVLKDLNPINRLNAAIALGFMEGNAEPATPALLEATMDSNRDVREAAALALGAIGCDAPKAISSLAECLHAEDIILRSSAVTYLRKLAPNTEWAAGGE